MAVIFGNKLIVKCGGVVIGASKSCQITKTCDTKEISSPSTGKARTFVAGRSEWSVTVDGLITSTDKISMLDNVGASFVLSIGYENGSKRQGVAILTSCTQTGASHEIATYSCIYQGSGALSAQ